MKLCSDNCSQWHKANKPSLRCACFGGRAGEIFGLQEDSQLPRTAGVLRAACSRQHWHPRWQDLCAGLNYERPDQRNSWSEAGRYFLKEMGDRL